MNKDEFTNKVMHLEVNETHSLYVQDWGNKDVKVPIISLHGGPGGQSKDSHKGSYDPTTQRVIFFDQRGCGQSLPYGSLIDNTTNDLISDITTIAETLKIESFILRGSSWGACLALAYAIKHPSKVHAMVLQGIFTGSSNEIKWLKHGMFQTFYPDVWQKYLELTPKAHRHDPSSYHFEKALNGTPDEQKKSAFAYETLEAGVVKLDDRGFTNNFDDYDPVGMRMEMHYMQNQCFLPDNYILDNAHKLTMPITLIQGRYDMVCPPSTAFALRENLPNSELYTTLSGHVTEHEDVQLVRQALKNLSS